MLKRLCDGVAPLGFVVLLGALLLSCAGETAGAQTDAADDGMSGDATDTQLEVAPSSSPSLTMTAPVGTSEQPAPSEQSPGVQGSAVVTSSAVPPPPAAVADPEPSSAPSRGEPEPTSEETEAELPDAGPARPLPDLRLDTMDDPVKNSELCPSTTPAAGDGCPELDLSCKYGEELYCRSRWVCTRDGTWAIAYAERDCPGDCPEIEPTEGEPCAPTELQCTFGEDAKCRSWWLCEDAAWVQLQAARDCDSDVYCPPTQPAPWTLCDDTGRTPQSELCIYPGGANCRCDCVPDPGLETPILSWECEIRPYEYRLRPCPLTPPEPGSPCDYDGPNCRYDVEFECRADVPPQSQFYCYEGVWNLLDLPQ